MLNETSETNHAAQLSIHNINSSISALQVAMEVIKDEWRSNPELVERILPLTLEKINQLHLQIINFNHIQPKFPSSKK